MHNSSFDLSLDQITKIEGAAALDVSVREGKVVDLKLRLAEYKRFYTQGVRSSWWKVIAYPKGKFIRNYLIKQGFRDGMPGLLLAIMMSFHSFLTRAKLYLLQMDKGS